MEEVAIVSGRFYQTEQVPPRRVTPRTDGCYHRQDSQAEVKAATATMRKLKRRLSNDYGDGEAARLTMVRIWSVGVDLLDSISKKGRNQQGLR